MKVGDTVFCVECNSMVDRVDAEVIFRTGFYKVTIPLAHCKACAEKSQTIENELLKTSPHMLEYVKETVAGQPLLV
jgi:hypothetical protein